jgi:hypothetical protein
MTVGPCAWTATHTHHSPEDLAEWNIIPANIQTLANTLGCGALWAATGRRFDACPQIARPIIGCVHMSEVDLISAPTPPSYMGSGEWLNLPAGGQCCLEVDRRRANLDGPVAAVTEVKIDGVLIAANKYRVDDGHILTRIDGLTWPLWQDIALPSTAVGSFTVKYTQGITPPAWLLSIAGTYALEVARGVNGSTACRLPSRVTSIVRQGVAKQFIDPTVLLQNGLTGIPEIDATVNMLNPSRLQRPLRVFSPNMSAPKVGV